MCNWISANHCYCRLLDDNVFAFIGVRPQSDTYVVCHKIVDLRDYDRNELVAFMNDFAMPTLERDPEWENLIFETTDRWIWSLEHDIEPKEGMDRVKASKPLLALAAYKRIYGEDPIPETITLPYDESLEEKARQYKKLVEEKKALAAQVKDKETQLLGVEASMTEALRGYQRGVMETPDDKLVISVKETQRRVFDKTELENYLNATGVKNPEGEAFDLGKDFYTSRSSYSLKFGFESDTPKRKRKSV